ncbi:RILP-like protein 1 isoform X2 [Scleropages formosus]|uniref:RILP-like protein 2 n=1 Tax=Scleropages formosus TaxID=113540 RepID=A0A8C9U4U1_SCLFO|nr:RILP-like protein 1 isoform X2 [Scleropages formosus]
MESTLEKPVASLTVDDVYDVAKAIGAEVEKLIDSFGKEAVVGLVPKIVRVLELLESFAARSQSCTSKEEELLKAYETFQAQQQQQQQKKKKKAVKEADDDSVSKETRDLQQKEDGWHRRLKELEAQVLQLQEQNQELMDQLRISTSQEDRAQRQEREVMLKLKAVVDKQRDEIRAKTLELSSLSKEVEALQEQLERFMKMNAELRQKQSIMQAQAKSAVERKVDLEADLQEKLKEIQRLNAQLEAANTRAAVNENNSAKPEIDLTHHVIIDLHDPNRPCFTKQEVRDMIFERNELKANLFLLQEELSYYQREILNDERCPGFLLDAVRTAIKKQRTVIKAKMLGIREDECSSDEECKGPLFEKREADVGEDCTDSRPPESRIRNLFGFLTRYSLGQSPTQQNTGSSWEILSPEETEPTEGTSYRLPH